MKNNPTNKGKESGEVSNSKNSTKKHSVYEIREVWQKVGEKDVKVADFEKIFRLGDSVCMLWNYKIDEDTAKFMKQVIDNETRK